MKVDAALFAKYSFTSRIAKYHRTQIRRALGFRPATEADEARWAGWLATEVCPVESDRGRLAAAVRRRCRSEKVEPPAFGQVERAVASAVRMYPSDFADCPEPVRYTLLATLCWVRQAEIIDALVGLLIDLVWRINARAERRVEKELIGSLSSVPGKKTIYVKMLTAVLDRPATRCARRCIRWFLAGSALCGRW
ncbi:hypothetical protein GCM10012275_50880 [Longimycelium tulufanense]|uniref:DUF4158 domain-containing protein n=1 Tax=Longimycelium tulufanense TaxID=907463 RepID=A0A8J3CJ20_9PSEU|nr:DUF4158 domain-containing protein [Longimycelium tulufanense]GGM73997.1 hypothetical protein GCM10012275_50880 [Longimycelium tulufanense]